jgi:preprotein translocase subunit SecY
VLKAFLNAFRVPDLRAKILFSLFIIAMFRLGSYLPVPVVDIGILQRELERQGAGGFLGIINLFSGGGLSRLSIFSLGIMPYITSSIIMQLMTVVIPKLQQWQEQGETGTKKINQWTRYVTVVLALLQSTGLVFLFHNPNASGIPDVFPTGAFTGQHVAFIVLIMTAGTALIMWLGELITQRGVGNGMSILIFTSVISTLPFEGRVILEQGGTGKFVAIMLIGMAIVVAVIYVDQGQRRVPIQYAKRVVGRKMTSGGSTYLPLKVNQAGVIPIIFATSVLYFPALLVLLHGDPVRPGAHGRQPSEERGVHPRYPSRSAHRRLPEQDPDPDRAAGGDLPGRDRPHPDDRVRVLEPPAVPVRRHLDPDRRGRRPRDDEADRVAAAHAPLRRLPRIGLGHRCGSCCSAPPERGRGRRG